MHAPVFLMGQPFVSKQAGTLNMKMSLTLIIAFTGSDESDGQRREDRVVSVYSDFECAKIRFHRKGKKRLEMSYVEKVGSPRLLPLLPPQYQEGLER